MLLHVAASTAIHVGINAEGMRSISGRGPPARVFQYVILSYDRVCTEKPPLVRDCVALDYCIFDRLIAYNRRLP